MKGIYCLMKTIPVSKGQFAIVDDEDYQVLSQFKWCVNKGYAMRMSPMVNKSKRHCIYMHRVLLPTKFEVDHINGNRLDNRKANLRKATRSENMRNRKIAKNNKSGFKGVWFNTKRDRWVAYIKFDNKTHVLAHTANKHEAAHIYNQFAEQIFGEFARLNPL